MPTVLLKNPELLGAYRGDWEASYSNSPYPEHSERTNSIQLAKVKPSHFFKAGRIKILSPLGLSHFKGMWFLDIRLIITLFIIQIKCMSILQFDLLHTHCITIYDIENNLINTK